MTNPKPTKVKVYIHDAVTNEVLAGQRHANFKTTGSHDKWLIGCDNLLVDSAESFKILSEKVEIGGNVAVYVEFPTGRKLYGRANIVQFSNEIPYKEFETFRLILEGAEVFRAIESAE